jgi:hypothetical protein
MEMNYLARDTQTGEIFRIFGCTSKEEAIRFIGSDQELLVLTDAEAVDMQIIGDENAEIIEKEFCL